MNKKMLISELFKQLNENKNNPITFFIKGITPADQGLEFLKSSIIDYHEYNFKEISNNLVYVQQNMDKALIKLEEKTNGFEYTLISGWRSEILLNFLLNEKSISNYKITDIIGGINNKGESILIVEIPKESHIFLPEEFSNLGWMIRPRL